MNRYDRMSTIDRVRRQPRADSSQRTPTGPEATARNEAVWLAIRRDATSLGRRRTDWPEYARL